MELGYGPVVQTGLQTLITLACGWATAATGALCSPDELPRAVRLLNQLVMRVFIPALQLWLLAVHTDMRHMENWRVLGAFMVWTLVVQLACVCWSLVFEGGDMARMGVHALVLAANNTGILAPVVLEAALGPSAAPIGMLATVALYFQQLPASELLLQAQAAAGVKHSWAGDSGREPSSDSKRVIISNSNDGSQLAGRGAEQEAGSWGHSSGLAVISKGHASSLESGQIQLVPAVGANSSKGQLAVEHSSDLDHGVCEAGQLGCVMIPSDSGQQQRGEHGGGSVAYIPNRLHARHLHHHHIQQQHHLLSQQEQQQQQHEQQQPLLPRAAGLGGGAGEGPNGWSSCCTGSLRSASQCPVQQQGPEKGLSAVMLKNPLVWCTACAALLSACGSRDWLYPTSPSAPRQLLFIEGSLGWLGRCCVPVTLLSTGLWMHGRVRGLLSAGNAKQVAAYLCLKLFVLPWVMLGVARVMGIGGQQGVALVLLTAVPVGNTAFVVSERHGQGTEALTATLIAGLLLLLPHVLGVLWVIEAWGLFPAAMQP